MSAPRNKCLTVNEFSLNHYDWSVAMHNNSASNAILEDLWKEHEKKVDDGPPYGTDYFSGPINQLIQNNHVKRNCRNWKSNIRSVIEKMDLSSQCNSVPRCGTTHSLDHLNVFLNNEPQTTKEFLPAEEPSAITTTHQTFNPPQKSESFLVKNELQSKPKDFVFNKNCNQNEKIEEIQPNDNQPPARPVFKTARDQLLSTNPAAKRSLGTARKTPGKFVSPMMSEKKEEEPQEETDERLKHIDPKMVELIQSEIIDNGTHIEWDDIAGLQTAKTVIQEAVVWPLLRPDIFTGLRRPPKGVLLFGPPGTGKTLIGKCIASQCRATFFNISASSLTSKWIGDGEKMVRALFAVARTCQPAVVFVDEIDSLLTQRSDAEHEATRRIKTEFLVQFDGAGTGEEDRILIVGATNRPQELDEAARRRLVKRLYIPLPDYDARKQIINNLMRAEHHSLTPSDVKEICELSEGYSGADMRSLCSEAAMGPIRSVPLSQMINVQSDQVRPVLMEDFRSALRRVRPSVSPDDLAHYIKWNATFGFDR